MCCSERYVNIACQDTRILGVLLSQGICWPTNCTVRLISGGPEFLSASCVANKRIWWNYLKNLAVLVADWSHAFALVFRHYPILQTFNLFGSGCHVGNTHWPSALPRPSWPGFNSLGLGLYFLLQPWWNWKMAFSLAVLAKSLAVSA